MAKTNLLDLSLPQQIAAVRHYHVLRAKAARTAGGLQDPFLTSEDIRRKFLCLDPKALFAAYVADEAQREERRVQEARQKVEAALEDGKAQAFQSRQERDYADALYRARRVDRGAPPNPGGAAKRRYQKIPWAGPMAIAATPKGTGDVFQVGTALVQDPDGSLRWGFSPLSPEQLGDPEEALASGRAHRLWVAIPYRAPSYLWIYPKLGEYHRIGAVQALRDLERVDIKVTQLGVTVEYGSVRDPIPPVLLECSDDGPPGGDACAGYTYVLLRPGASQNVLANAASRARAWANRYKQRADKGPLWDAITRSMEACLSHLPSDAPTPSPASLPCS